MAHYEDITIDQGADFAMELHLVETDGSKKNLDRYSVAAKMKKNYNSVDSADIVTFNAIVANPSNNGIITLLLTNEQTDALNYKKTYVYDVEISYVDSDDNTIIERVMEGTAEIKPSVTK